MANTRYLPQETAGCTLRTERKQSDRVLVRHPDPLTDEIISSLTALWGVNTHMSFCASCVPQSTQGHTRTCQGRVSRDLT